MGIIIENCPACKEGICFENSLILRKCKNYDLCLLKQILNKTKEPKVINLYEFSEVEDD